MPEKASQSHIAKFKLRYLWFKGGE